MLKEKVKRMLRQHVDYAIYEKIVEVYGIVIQKPLRFKYREKKVSFGNQNPNQTFYVIRCLGRAAFFQYYYFVVAQIIYACKRGYTPVIDMTDKGITYRSVDKELGTENVWEYYFAQPEGNTLSEIRESKNVVLSTIFVPAVEDSLMRSAIHGDCEKAQFVAETICEYLRYNKKTMLHLENQYEIVIKSKGATNVLGVHIRGTDYVALKPKGHSIQPDIEYIVAETNKLIEKWGIDLIYVCTEDAKMLSEFKKKINIEVVCTECKRLNQYVVKTIDLMGQLAQEQEKSDPYLSGLEYLTDIHLLSKCDYLLSGHGITGTRCAILMNGGQYKGQYLMDLGCY